MIVGICGKAGSGKDLAGEMLINMSLAPAQRLSMASPMKEICEKYFFFPHEYLYGSSDMRSRPHPKYGCTARDVLQRLGAEFGRDLVHKNIWVDHLLRSVNQETLAGFHNFVVTDIRFENEIAAIRASGGKVVKLVRNSQEKSGFLGFIFSSQRWRSHKSEDLATKTPDSAFDAVIKVPEGKGLLEAHLRDWADKSGWKTKKP